MEDKAACLIVNLLEREKIMLDMLYIFSRFDLVAKDEDHHGWGNADDSFSHGFEIAQSEIGVRARDCLFKVCKIMELVK